MDEEVKFKPIYSTSNKGTIALIKSLFESNSISYFVDNEHAAGLAAGQVSGVMTVMVTSRQYDLAKELIKDIN